MLSASHNPMPDNGIKFLARGGVKLDDAIEIAIEKRLREPWDRPTGAGRRPGLDVRRGGRRLRRPPASPPWTARSPASRSSSTAPTAPPPSPARWCSREAGAEVVAICAEPDGLNINDGCGSTHLDVLQRAVLEHGADVGFALDGDADRCLAVDHEGNVVDGDQLLAVLALAMRDAGTLKADTVVATVMSNLGLRPGDAAPRASACGRPRSATATSSRR